MGASPPSSTLSITEPGALADTAGYWPRTCSHFEQKVQILETVRRVGRAATAGARLAARAADADAAAPARADSARTSTPAWRSGGGEYILRKQLESIRKELGEDETSKSSRSSARRSPNQRCPTTCANRRSVSFPASSASARAHRSVVGAERQAEAEAHAPRVVHVVGVVGLAHRPLQGREQERQRLLVVPDVGAAALAAAGASGGNPPSHRRCRPRAAASSAT